MQIARNRIPVRCYIALTLKQSCKSRRLAAWSFGALPITCNSCPGFGRALVCSLAAACILDATNQGHKTFQAKGIFMIITNLELSAGAPELDMVVSCHTRMMI